METLKWTTNISLNNRRIDEQHQLLFELTNNLINEKHAHVGDKIICDTLHELLEYIKFHFYDEEQFMKSVNYPYLEQHQKEHAEFVFQVAMFCKDVMDRKASLTEEIIAFLTDWLINHTSGSDFKIREYIESQNQHTKH